MLRLRQAWRKSTPLTSVGSPMATAERAQVRNRLEMIRKPLGNPANPSNRSACDSTSPIYSVSAPTSVSSSAPSIRLISPISSSRSM